MSIREIHKVQVRNRYLHYARYNPHAYMQILNHALDAAFFNMNDDGLSHWATGERLRDIDDLVKSVLQDGPSPIPINQLLPGFEQREERAKPGVMLRFRVRHKTFGKGGDVNAMDSVMAARYFGYDPDDCHITYIGKSRVGTPAKRYRGWQGKVYRSKEHE